MRTLSVDIEMTLVASPSAIDEIRKHLAAGGCNSCVTGEIIEGSQTVKFKGKLNWAS